MIPRGQLKIIQQESITQQKNVKANYDINELPEGRFTLTIEDNFI